jgi:polysaccharide biosynthesis transport protein
MSESTAQTNPSLPGASRTFSRVQRFVGSLKKWWWVSVITTGVGISLAAWNDSKKAPAYISVGRMMVSGRIAMPEGSVYSEELNNFYGTQSELMQSAEVRRRAVARVETLHPELQASSVSLSVSQQQGTSFFALQAIGDKGDYTQVYLNACMDEYIRFRREMQSMTHDTALTSITDEVLDLQKKLEAGNEDLLNFQKTNDVVFLDQDGNAAGRYLARLNERLTELKREFQLLSQLTLDQALERRAQASPASGESANPSGETASFPVGAEADYIKAKQQLQMLRVEKARRSQFLRPRHPIVLDLDAKISHQEKLIELNKELSLAQIANQRETIRTEIESVEASIKEQKGRALELQRRIEEYEGLKGKVEREKALSDKLLAGIQGITMNKSLNPDVVQIMEPASAPIATKLGLGKDLAVGGIAGLLFGLGLLFLSMLLDDRIVSADELQERFNEELLGQIPKEALKGRLSVLALGEKQHVFAESYRNLRSTLHFMSFEDVRPKTLLVTSAVPGEGKSTVAANLAITIAAGGSKTLLIDGDLRKGVAHEYFSLEASPGLSSVLAEAIPWRSAVCATELEGLSVLPRGKVISGTSEHFLSQHTDQLLKDIYGEYDCIIIDSAPVLANDDTASLAPKIDATVFVVRAGVSSSRLTRSALDALRRRQVNVLGLVLNAADGKSAEYYYYHKYGEYYAQAGAS